MLRLIFYGVCGIIAGLIVTSFMERSITALVVVGFGSVVVRFLLEALWKRPRRLIGWTFAALAFGLFLQMQWPIPEAVSPVERWLGERFGFGEYGQIGLEVLVIVILVVGSFLLLKRKVNYEYFDHNDQDVMDPPDESEWGEPPDGFLVADEPSPDGEIEEPIAGPRDVDTNDGDDYPRPLDEDAEPYDDDDPRWATEEEDPDANKLRIDVMKGPRQGVRAKDLPNKIDD